MSAYQLLKRKLKTAQYTWLVTGVAGFIGCNLLKALLNLDQRVVGLDNFSTGQRTNLHQIRDAVGATRWAQFSLIEGDICEMSHCIEAVKGVDYVLHEAALGSVPRSVADPIATNQSNVTGFLNMLVASRNAGVKRFVYAASSSTYGDHPGMPKVEDRIGNPMSPYAVSKYVNELYAGVFAHLYGFNSIGLRYFNVFGFYQDPNGDYAAVIPKWISTMIKGEPIIINGDGETSRDFCFAENVIQANLLSATVNKIKALNQVFNVAVGVSTTLIELHAMIKKELLNRLPYLKIPDPEYRDFRNADIRHSLASTAKAGALLGYHPTHTLHQGMTELIEWHANNSSSILK